MDFDFKEVVRGRTDPIQSLIRREAKRELAKALDRQDDPFDQARMTTGVSVMGSTLFSISKREFPFVGRKVEDFDLRTDVPPQHNTESASFEEDLRRRFWQAFEGALEECGFEFIIPNRHRSKDPALHKNVIVCADFARQDIEKILEGVPHADDVCVSAGHPAYLEMEMLGPGMVTTLFRPRRQMPGFPNMGDFPILWDHPLQYASKVISRSIYHDNFQTDSDPSGFKPLDLLNLYNAMNAKPAAFDMDPNSPTSDVSSLRMAVIVNLAVMRKKLDQVNPESFLPDHEAVLTLKEAIRPKLALTHGFTNDLVADFLKSWVRTVRAIFPVPESTHERESRTTALYLTKKEREFVETCQGFTLRDGSPGNFIQVPPAILPGLLQEDIPEPFEADSMLTDRINFSPALREFAKRVRMSRF